jgi:hypothetical protein
VARWNQTRVFLKVGSLRGPLTLKRHPLPKFLRFVLTGSDWKTLDALDQLDDAPRPGEFVIAAVKADESSVHFDGYRGGKRAGWWERTATYERVPDQPPQDVLTDTARWQAWATEQNTPKEG